MFFLINFRILNLEKKIIFKILIYLLRIISNFLLKIIIDNRSIKI
jgi:hypothetical protein